MSKDITDEVYMSLPRSGRDLMMCHYPYLDGDMPSVWKFRACFSEVFCRKTSDNVMTCPLFSQATINLAHSELTLSSPKVNSSRLMIINGQLVFLQTVG